MNHSLRTRLNIYVELDHSRRLQQLAATRGISKSAIVATALGAFLSPDGETRRETATVRRLDRLTRQFEHLERDQNILIETLALFIRYELSVSTAVPEAHQDAVRAQGKARFEKFIAQLARHLQRGGSLVRELHAEVYPDNSSATQDGSENDPEGTS